MHRDGIDACIISDSDIHLNEYPAACSKFRSWISGFKGSAGTLVVTQDVSVLWTDSRYFLQAEKELKDTEIQLFLHLAEPNESMHEWIAAQNLQQVGFDGSVTSAEQGHFLSTYFTKKGIRVCADFKPQESIWQDRPAMPKMKAFDFPESFSGEATASKMSRISNQLDRIQLDCYISSKPDEIAWALNIRGFDIEFNPVVLSHACFFKHLTHVFIEKEKLSLAVTERFSKDNIQIHPYEGFHDFASSLAHLDILIDKNTVSYESYVLLHKSNNIRFGTSPVSTMKSIKNTKEIQGFKESMLQDGLALCRALHPIQNVSGHQEMSEYDLGKIIESKRAGFSNYLMESFHPIVAKGSNGAIVHYQADMEQSTKIFEDEGALLIDCGAHYMTGTTDITRTFYIGAAPQSFKMDYTLVLKGLISLSSAIFPEGTRGSQLDILSRKALWDQGLTYLHGSGHGVGHVLNVHEGPQNIRLNENPTMLLPGMVLSNEPGIYRKGQWGIRLENLVVVKEWLENDFGKFYAFETLTLFPFESDLIIKEMLSLKEIDWLNKYHQSVRKQLLPHIDEALKTWIISKTNTI